MAQIQASRRSDRCRWPGCARRYPAHYQSASDTAVFAGAKESVALSDASKVPFANESGQLLLLVCHCGDHVGQFPQLVIGRDIARGPAAQLGQICQ
jgi:hypothetical protein